MALYTANIGTLASKGLLKGYTLTMESDGLVINVSEYDIEYEARKDLYKLECSSTGNVEPVFVDEIATIDTNEHKKASPKGRGKRKKVRKVR